MEHSFLLKCPIEIPLLIASFLNPSDLARLIRVSRVFRSEVFETTLYAKDAKLNGRAIFVAIAESSDLDLSLKILRKSLLAGGDVSRTYNYKGHQLSAIHIAAMKGEEEIAKELVDGGADLCQQATIDPLDTKLFDLWCFLGFTMTIDRLSHTPILPLTIPALNGDAGMVEALIERGAPGCLSIPRIPGFPVGAGEGTVWSPHPNSATLTLLHASVVCDSIPIMQLALRDFPSLKNQKCLGSLRTAAHSAVLYGSQELLSLLLQHDIDLEVEDYVGRTPLHTAVNKFICMHHFDDQKLCFDSIKILTKAGANVDAIQTRLDGATPLINVVRFSPDDWKYTHRIAKQIVDHLLDNGADINATTVAGDSALGILAGIILQRSGSQSLENWFVHLVKRGASLNTTVKRTNGIRKPLLNIATEFQRPPRFCRLITALSMEAGNVQ